MSNKTEINGQILESMLLSRDNLVVQANVPISGKQEQLSASEAELIRLAISQVKKSDIDFLVYRCSSAQLGKALSLLKALSKKTLKIITGKDTQGNDNFVCLPWFYRIEYEEGIISMRLNDALKECLLTLSE